MNKTILPLAAAMGLLVPGQIAAQPQDGGTERVNQVIIFGDDECPASEGDTITVCARLDESERFRIPPRLRGSSSPDNEAWARRAQSFEVIGRFGPLSCSTVGSGSELGCTAEMIRAAYAERAQSSDVRFSQLIAEQRAERLATLDAEAAATQARVEELERAYLERVAREQGEVLPGEEEELPRLVNPERVVEPPPAPNR